MQNYCHSSAGFAAQPGRSRFKARRTTWCPSRLDEQRQRPGAKLSHPQVQSELREWREAISPAEPGKKLPWLFVARGLEEEQAPESGSDSHLSPSEWLGLWKSSVSPGGPSSQGVSPSPASRAAAPLARPGQPQLAVSQHLPGGAAPGTNTERTGSLSGALPPGLSGLGQGGEGSCGPGDGGGPAVAGARRHPAARGAQSGGRAAGTAAFPCPRGSPAPFLPPPPIPDFIYKQLEPINLARGKGGKIPSNGNLHPLQP